MSDKFRIAFLGMMVGGTAFLSAGMAVYLTTAQLQYSSMARLQDRQATKVQDRVIQAQGPAELTRYARVQPSQ
jgi:hypothetical protein